MSEATGINNITNTGNFNYRNNTNTITGDKRERVAKVRQIQEQAERLCKLLQNPDGYRFYCKVGWRLSEAAIQTNLEKALNAKHEKVDHNPAKFFSYLCDLELT
jgi:hypothetical protein